MRVCWCIHTFRFGKISNVNNYQWEWGGTYQLTTNLNRFPLQPKANNSNLKKKRKRKKVE